jgi:hypothetical protein
MDRACSTYGGRGEVNTEIWWGTLREGDYLEDPCAEGRIIFKWIFEKWTGMHGLDRFTQDTDRWRGVVNAVINLRVP